MWPDFWRINCTLSIVHRFRILVVGKVSICATLSKHEVKPMLILIIERVWEIFACKFYFQSGHVGAYSLIFRIYVCSTCLCLETRLHQNEDPISTSRFDQTITAVLLFTSILDLNLVMPRACKLSRISLQTVPIRPAHLRKDCMPSGREAMSKLL